MPPIQRSIAPQGLVVNSTLSPLVERIQPMVEGTGFGPAYGPSHLRRKEVCRILSLVALQSYSYFWLLPPMMCIILIVFSICQVATLWLLRPIRLQVIRPSMVESLHTFSNNHLVHSLICSRLCIVSSSEQS